MVLDFRGEKKTEPLGQIGKTVVPKMSIKGLISILPHNN